MKKIFMFYFSLWGNTNYPADVDAATGATPEDAHLQANGSISEDL